MSSLMQHSGRCDRAKGVELFIYLVKEVPWIVGDLSLTKKEDCETVELTWNDKKHTVPKLYRIWRKPVDMLGCWVRFRINGELTAPDLSCPVDLYKLPRDAKPLTDSEAIQVWSN